jgi:Endonuclease I/Secretion system C-terminal sorting domain/Abnormal spindle-like microcephaly-assoc'd, ASPM-SPD-2-Hydin
MKLFSAALLAACTVWSSAQAQTIAVNGASQLNFGTATELAPQTRTLIVSNPTTVPVNVNTQLFTTYGQPAFAVSPASFSVPAGGSQTVTVTFAPLHNIQHNSELVLTTDHLGAISVDLQGQGQYSNGYYSTTQNLSEQALLTALKTRTTTGHNALGYNTGRDRMFMTIDNKRVNGQGATVNTLECIYTGRVITGFSSRSAAQNQNFNTEHTWPQSFFNSADPMVSDLNHLFPTDNDANNSRNNFPFGVATTPYRNDNINTPSHLGANNKYEPRDPQKGRTARAIMYFVTRYQNYAGFFTSQQTILRQWARQFPVTAQDRRRNDDVFAAQGNRNPFIDYPQLMDRITNFVGNPSVPQDSTTFYRSAASIDYGTVAGPTTYSYVWVNTGTLPITITGATPTSNTSGVTISTPSFTGTVAPGESVTFLVTLDPGAVTGPITGTLALAYGTTGTLSVPITANAGPTATPQELAAAGIALELYPNPATAELTVVRHASNPALVGQKAYSIEILDGLGRVVRQHATTTEELTVLDVSGLPAGLYVVRAGGLSRRLMVK